MSAERALRLTGRSGSHFTRVARMMADELGLALELEVLHDLTSLDAALYGNNPALKIPTLHVDGGALFGTENICCRLAELAGRADDPRVVLTHHHRSDLVRSAQELVWHAMAAQVQLLVGLRFAKLPADNLFFAKAQAGLLGTLAWLDAHLDEVLDALPAPRDVSVFELTLFCLMEHMQFRRTVSLEQCPRLIEFARSYGARPSAQRTPYQADATSTPRATAPNKG